MKRVLVVVDMQNDFVSGVLGSEGARGVIGPIAERIAVQRQNGWPVLYTADTHPQEEYDAARSRESGLIPRHCVAGESGWKVVDELAPIEGDLIIQKNSFQSLRLPDAIGNLDPDDVIELCGVCTDICVVSNALHLRACYPDNRIAVLKDLCAGTSEKSHEAALTVMKSCLIDIE